MYAIILIDQSQPIPGPKLVSFSACTCLRCEETNSNYRIAYLFVEHHHVLLAFWFLPTNAGESEWKDACCWFSNFPSVELANKCTFSNSSLFVGSIIRIPYYQSDSCASSAATASSNNTPSSFPFSTCTKLPLQELNSLESQTRSRLWDRALTFCWIYFSVGALLHLFILDFSGIKVWYVKPLLHFQLSKVVTSYNWS